MLAVARAVRGTRLPAPPSDPEQLVVYATASEGQAQPSRRGGVRYRTSGDVLYTTYALLGELAGGAFSFDADTRLEAEPARLARARTLWLPRGDTLDPGLAQALVGWVRAGGTLIVSDPDAFGRTPSGASLAPVRDELIGAPLGPRRTGTILEVEAGALGAGVPDDLLTVPLVAPGARGFAAVPAGARVAARFIDGAPAAILRPVGAGRVLAFAADPMAPGALDDPMDLARLVADVHRWAGGSTSAAWTYRLPGDPDPGRLPWEGAVPPEAARAGL
jgi:hypothetical protein